MSTASHPDDERSMAAGGTVEAERRRNWIRFAFLLVMTLVFAGGGGGTGLSGSARVVGYVILGIGWVYTLGLEIVQPHRRLAARTAALLNQGADGLLILWWIGVTGGLDSVWSPTVYVIVSSISQRYSPRSTLIAAAFYGASIVVTALVLGQVAGRYAEIGVRLFLMALLASSAMVGTRERARFLQSRIRLLDLTQEVANIGTWEWSVNEELITWSAELYRIFGMPRGMRPTLDSYLAAIHSEDREEVARLIGEALADRRPFHFDHRVVWPDGSVHWVHCRGRVHVGKDGRVRELVGSAEDITEQRKVEEQLRFQDKLASIGTLSSGIAHEVSTPLAYLANNLELIERLVSVHPSGTDPRLRESLSAARHASERVREIVQGLKSFSRGQDDTKTLVELPHVTDLAITMVAHELEKRARLVRTYESAPCVRANESRLSQVFINLLLNAIQAIDAGEKSDNVVTIHVFGDDDGRAHVSVSDTGQGIAAEDLPKIFDPFFTTKPTGVGTGLGLSICHGIIRDLGGDITVFSKPGEGASFEVTLPGARPDRKVAEPPPPIDAKLRGRILVVDDEPRYGRSLRMLLEADHDVAIAEGGKEALSILSSGQTFDLILCDLMMPGMNGMDLHAALATSYPSQHERMVFLTGGPTTETARTFLARADVRHLTKPTHPDELERLIEEMIRKRGS